MGLIVFWARFSIDGRHPNPTLVTSTYGGKTRKSLEIFYHKIACFDTLLQL